jgi:imidazolonepropionase-like amidohydrolase
VAKTKLAHTLKDAYWQAVGNAPYIVGYGYTLCSDGHSLRLCRPYITVPTTSFEYEV